MAHMAQARCRPPKTVEDYLALPMDVRAELIDGELYLMPEPTTTHQDVVGSLYMHLRLFVDSEDCGRVFVSPVDVYLTSGDIVQPDVVFITSANEDSIGDMIRGAPTIAVEVVSPSSPERDRFVKKMLYRANHVSEYWIADPQSESVEVFRLESDRYVPAGWFTRQTTLTSRLLPGFALPLEQVFRGHPG